MHEHLVLTGFADVADAAVVRSTRAWFGLRADDDHTVTPKAEIVSVGVIGLVAHELAVGVEADGDSCFRFVTGDANHLVVRNGLRRVVDGAAVQPDHPSQYTSDASGRGEAL